MPYPARNGAGAAVCRMAPPLPAHKSANATVSAGSKLMMVAGQLATAPSELMMTIRALMTAPDALMTAISALRMTSGMPVTEDTKAEGGMTPAGMPAAVAMPSAAPP